MKRIQLIALFLLTVTLAIASIDAQAQWRVKDSYNEWGEKNKGELIAVSEPARSVNGIGKQIYLHVISSCRSSIWLEDETPMFLYLIGEEDHEGDYIYDTPIQVNGIEHEKTLGVGSRDADSFILLSSEISSESSFEEDINNATRLLARASTFKMIVPTREYGQLIYQFDMTGAKEAIQAVCVHPVQ